MSILPLPYTLTHIKQSKTESGLHCTCSDSWPYPVNKSAMQSDLGTTGHNTVAAAWIITWDSTGSAYGAAEALLWGNEGRKHLFSVGRLRLFPLLLLSLWRRSVHIFILFPQRACDDSQGGGVMGNKTPVWVVIKQQREREKLHSKICF